MSRKRVLIHAITWTTLVVFIIIGSSSLVNGEPVSEVRSAGGGTGNAGGGGSSPHFIQSRPVYQKPAPYKPKLVLAKQLQLQTAKNNGGGGGGDEGNNLITQTVYGFLDFTTTVGNTVMIFTPQTKKVELIQPSSTVLAINPTAISEDAEAGGDDGNSEEGAEDGPSTPGSASSTTARQPKQLTLDGEDPEIIILESSEADVLQPSSTLSSLSGSKSQKGSIVLATPVDYVSLATEGTTGPQGKNKGNSLPTSSPVEIRTQVNVVSSSDDDEPQPPTTTTPKGFTLKLSNKPSTTTSTYSNGSYTSSSSSSSSAAAAAAGKKDNDKKVAKGPQIILGSTQPLPASIVTPSSRTTALISSSSSSTSSPPSNVFAQTVVLSPVHNNHANVSSTLTKYAQVTAQIVPTTSSSSGSSSANFVLPQSFIIAKKASAQVAETVAAAPTQAPSSLFEVRTEQSVISSSGAGGAGGASANDEQGNHGQEAVSGEALIEESEPSDDEHEDGEEHEEDEQEHEEVEDEAIEPTSASTAQDEQQQTLYVLPQKNSKNLNNKEKTAQIYVSKSPAPDSYSRQPQLYVDIVQPAKSYDYVVTATPTSSSGGRKQFRSQAPSSSGGTRNEYLNRFSNRFSRKQPASSTESNELTDRPSSAATPSPYSYEQFEESPSPSPSTFTRTRSSGGGSGGGGSNRFRTRNNRGKVQNNQDIIEPTSASTIYSQSATATTPSRRFNSGRTRNNAKNYQSFDSEKSTTSSPAASRGGYSPSRQKTTITPTSSSSIYRFKLNRPTGRWRFKPSPKPKVSIIKSKDDEPVPTPAEIIGDADGQSQFQQRELLQQQSNGPVYPQQYGVPIDGNENYQYAPSGGSGGNEQDDPRAESNELVQDEHGGIAVASAVESHLVPQTLRVATVTPTEFSDLDKYLEIATIKSPYVFQAGNVKNTRYITVTKTFTKEIIQPTQVLEVHETLENILATRAPYEKILEGSNDVATLPVVILGEDMATPPLETVTQTFSTTQLMLKTSILPVLYDGVTTLYTLTQSYFVTRLVTAHKTVPPMELFQFVPTKSLREFNTALQEAESEHREQLLGSESDIDNENDQSYQQIVAAPDELKAVGSEFDPSFMDDKLPQAIRAQQQSAKSSKSLPPKKTSNAIPDLSNLTPEQLAFFRFLTAQATNGGQQPQQQLQQQQQQQQQAPAPNPLIPNYFGSPQLPILPSPQQLQPYALTSSPVVIDTTTTIVETKTLRILFGAKPTQTTLYSTRVVPTKVTTYISASIPSAPPQQPQIPGYFQGAYPFGAFVG